MRRDRRFQLTLGLAVGASLAFLAFLLVRPVGDGSVRLTANLASCWRRRRPRAAMLSFPGQAERAALQACSLLDGAVIATSLLYTSWALVLGPVFWVGGAPVLLLGAGLLSLAVADTSFACLTQEGTYTNLPNRALFRERVGHALRRRSQAGTPLALLFIDLDDFKTVNDQLGHAASDDLLVAVAGRLKTYARGAAKARGKDRFNLASTSA
jgi:hypothetical protein